MDRSKIQGLVLVDRVRTRARCAAGARVLCFLYPITSRTRGLGSIVLVCLFVCCGLQRCQAVCCVEKKSCAKNNERVFDVRARLDSTAAAASARRRRRPNRSDQIVRKKRGPLAALLFKFLLICHLGIRHDRPIAENVACSPDIGSIGAQIQIYHLIAIRIEPVYTPLPQPRSRTVESSTGSLRMARDNRETILQAVQRAGALPHGANEAQRMTGTLFGIVIDCKEPRATRGSGA